MRTPMQQPVQVQKPTVQAEAPTAEPDRFIFGPYWNGHKLEDGKPCLVWADPQPTHRRLNQALDYDVKKWWDQRFCDHVKDEKTGQWLLDENQQPVIDPARRPEVDLALTRLTEASCQAFAIVPFDPLTQHGATEAEILDVLDAFAAYLDYLQKKTEIAPTRSPSSVDSNSDSSTTKPKLACG